MLNFIEDTRHRFRYLYCPKHSKSLLIAESSISFKVKLNEIKCSILPWHSHISSTLQPHTPRWLPSWEAGPSGKIITRTHEPGHIITPKCSQKDLDIYRWCLSWGWLVQSQRWSTEKQEFRRRQWSGTARRGHGVQIQKKWEQPSVTPSPSTTNHKPAYTYTHLLTFCFPSWNSGRTIPGS